MQSIQREIAQQLKVQAPFKDWTAIDAEVNRRITFIQDCLRNSGLKSLVLGISGGVDSLTAGLLAQKAIKELRTNTGDGSYRFIAVRLPYETQFDEYDANASVDFIKPDEHHTINIGPVVKFMANEVKALQGKTAVSRDFVLGNTKARIRMVTQYTIASAYDGMVIGTDHAAEAVMGFFTKFGDGACDLAPLSGLVKNQVRTIARYFNAPEPLVEKIPTADLENLSPGKPDEVSYGVTYAEIDAFLYGEPVCEKAFKIICDTYYKTRHKRVMPFSP
ncbi:ammonia-dependent NAD(+) synthetase [Candidatus Pseudomonas adelgestsugas]|uniref:NH(3)-dependent NAD(+) synthetase n=1 Tax=Candidatus Pseudomonas adelgestsugas TaxID=1302376 RepID=A0ABX5R7Z1_9PSED|nr:ammonia-dependent NAD(+) synthetase [Candidatus Pseudomonas adelgestsugas]QAX81604.1 NH(3)-dependent NAD(+) synthetase [Candidatus Pseudomonas adelgestsugas]